MNRPPLELLDRFRGLAVLVIGEAMLDSYLCGVSDRLCREAPVPIVAVARRRDAPGGAANAAANARSLGAHVTLLSVIGGDAEGAMLRHALADRDVGTEAVISDPTRHTLAKQRVLAGTQLLVRFDHGTTERVSPDREAEIVARLERLFPIHDAVIVSDYGYGILTPEVVATLARLQARSPRVIVLDSKTLPSYRTVGVTAVKPNYDEAMRLLGDARSRRVDRIPAISDVGDRLLDVTGAQIAAVTLDGDGALFFERGRAPYRTYARRADHSRAAGAGDTFVAALALGLAAAADLPGAAEIAAAAAGVVVEKDGTAVCTGPEVRARIAGDGKYWADRDALAGRLENHRRTGARIVLTNGCFDLLHRGHVSYLNEAKALGEVLVVGVNSDASVRRLKGPRRPINALEDRAQVLAAMTSVDYVVPFDEDTPIELVRALRPDVFVKGGDYTPEMLPEAPTVRALGGSVRILPYVEDRSTTSIIERIHAASDGRLENAA